jgi:hypothetical protein
LEHYRAVFALAGCGDERHHAVLSDCHWFAPFGVGSWGCAGRARC